MPGPRYREVADDLRSKIESGQLQPGERLPTEDQLIEQYEASRNTVRAAVKELATRGLVETRHGKGTFVAEQVNPIVTTLTTDPETGGGGGEGLVYIAEVAASGRKATSDELRVEIQAAPPHVADALKIPIGTDVVSRHEPRYVDEKPWSLQTSWYPMALADQAPRLRRSSSILPGTVSYLREHGVQQVGYRDSIEVRSPDRNETAFFGLPVDGRIQVVEIFRVAFDQDKNRFRLTITVYRADRNRFVINVGDVPESTILSVAD
jgi:GntR family transcriptional regulator